MDHIPKTKAKSPHEKELVIPTRTIMGRDVAAADDTEPKTTPESLLVPLHKTVEPLKPKATAAAAVSAAPSAAKPAAPAAPAPTPQPQSAPASEPQESTDAATPKAHQKDDAEATAQAVRRERELQEYINNRKYFVPIDAKRRRRSIKISFGLVLLLLLLSLVLIDLLLDSGAILLLQKIPHTHFFDAN